MYHHPCTVEEIFKDYSSRRSAVVQALTSDVDKFYALCDPKKENLCLFGHRNGSWKVNLPSEEVPSEIPEPALGINFSRDGMKKSDWLSLVAIHTDCWLVAVAFYLAACLRKRERKALYIKMNELPTVYEVFKKEMNAAETDKPGVDCGSKSKDSGKRVSDEQMESDSKAVEENSESNEDK